MVQQIKRTIGNVLKRFCFCLPLFVSMLMTVNKLEIMKTKTEQTATNVVVVYYYYGVCCFYLRRRGLLC